MGGSLVKGDWIGVSEDDSGDTILIRHPHVKLVKPLKISINFDQVEEVPVLTTDEIDKTDPNSRNKLVGYCEMDDHYTYYDQRVQDGKCEKCGGAFSNWIGFQYESQRTFKYTTAKKRKRPKGK